LARAGEDKDENFSRWTVRLQNPFATAARLKDIQGRLADEFHAVERLIAASKSAFRH